jgi:hypothetical protein
MSGGVWRGRGCQVRTSSLSSSPPRRILLHPAAFMHAQVDENEGLRRLMRFPPVGDIKVICRQVGHRTPHVGVVVVVVWWWLWWWWWWQRRRRRWWWWWWWWWWLCCCLPSRLHYCEGVELLPFMSCACAQLLRVRVCFSPMTATGQGAEPRSRAQRRPGQRFHNGVWWHAAQGVSTSESRREVRV